MMFWQNKLECLMLSSTCSNKKRMLLNMVPMPQILLYLLLMIELNKLERLTLSCTCSNEEKMPDASKTGHLVVDVWAE
jgi:hypothetical protein